MVTQSCTGPHTEVTWCLLTTVWTTVLVVETRSKTAGAEVSPANSKDGHTPLHWASLNGELEIVQVLIDKGAEVADTDLGLT